MTWDVEFHDAFELEFDALSADVQDAILAHAQLLETFGPSLGRPRVDTPKGSRHSNMKELWSAFCNYLRGFIYCKLDLEDFFSSSLSVYFYAHTLSCMFIG